MDNFTTQNRQIVFVDIVGYSLRSCVIQYRVIVQFMKDIEVALDKTVSDFKEFGLDRNSIAILPLGDAAAIVFPPQQNHNANASPYFLSFIKRFFSTIYNNNIENEAANCPNFADKDFCDCHPLAYSLRFGASIGELVVYKDLNNNQNYAGKPINMAARVMGVARKANQVALTQEAHEYIGSFYHHLATTEKFKEYKDAPIKHDFKINIYQYIDNNIAKLGLNLAELYSYESNPTSSGINNTRALPLIKIT